MPSFAPEPMSRFTRSPLESTERDPTAWRAGAWIGWTLLVAVEAIAATVAAFAISFGASSTCHEPARASNVIEGQRDIWIAVAVLAGPWLFAVFFSPRRWPRFVLGWLLGSVPLILMAVTHTQPHDWVGGFCF